jgi:multicomponent Na+:H+ antiporter subunit D
LQKTGIYPPELPSVNLDAEWGYRWLAPRVVRVTGTGIMAVDQRIRTAALAALSVALRRAERGLGPSDGISRHYPTGFMVTWVTILLAAYLLFYFL